MVSNVNLRPYFEVAEQRGLKDCVMNVCDLYFEGNDGVQVGASESASAALPCGPYKFEAHAPMGVCYVFSPVIATFDF